MFVILSINLMCFLINFGKIVCKKRGFPEFVIF